VAPLADGGSHGITFVGVATGCNEIHGVGVAFSRERIYPAIRRCIVTSPPKIGNTPKPRWA